MSSGLPSPTSGPSVFSYFLVGVLIVLVLLAVIMTDYTSFPGHVEGLRAALGLAKH